MIFKIMTNEKNIPIDVVHLLPKVNDKLMELLRSLTPGDWDRQTIAKLWKVKDVVAHLLDGNIRVLSMLRDGYYHSKPDLGTNEQLLNYLNELNADWVKAMKRVSPSMLMLLHEATGSLYNEYYASLDPFEKSPFSVAWAGEKESLNWMHIAREYTEKWLHQQQIRDTLSDHSLMSKEFFDPFIDIFMLALPYTYRNVQAAEGTTIKLTIPGEIGGSWNISKLENMWRLDKFPHPDPASEIIIDADTSWRLFSKSLDAADVKSKVMIKGNRELGEVALTMVSVMA